MASHDAIMRTIRKAAEGACFMVNPYAKTVACGQKVCTRKIFYPKVKQRRAATTPPSSGRYTGRFAIKGEKTARRPQVKFSTMSKRL